MKKYLLFVFALSALTFASCSDDDGYSLDKFWVSLATVENPNEDSAFYLHLDNGEVIWIGATNFYNYRPKTGQRIIADYTLLNDTPEGSKYDHDAKLNDAYNILTKGIINITPEIQDSIGHDAIHIRELWVGSDYLNIRFSYKMNNKRHMLNLVSDSSKVYNDGKVHLEFRHNANDDAESYTAGGLVSFELMSLKGKTTGNSLDLIIHSFNYEGKEETYNLTYNFNNKEERELDRDYFTEGQNLDVE